MDIVGSLERASALVNVLAREDHHRGPWQEVPALWANVLFTVLWVLVMLLHGGLGTWFRQWWFGISMTIGCALEFIGFLARTVASQQPENINAFLAQISSLILGPAFIMAGMYFLLAKLVMIYGRQYSPLRPMYYTAIFSSCDLLSIVIQAIGGGMASSAFQATPQKDPSPGTNTMVAGMAVQVATMTVFMFFFLWFYFKVYAAYRTLKPGQSDSAVFTPAHADVRRRTFFKYLPFGVMVASVFVYIRCIYRLIELAEGWSGKLMVEERYSLVLDGLMCFIGVAIMVPLHPGFAFGRKHIPVSGLHKKADVHAVEEAGGSERSDSVDMNQKVSEA